MPHDGHDHTDPPSDLTLRVKALETALTRKGYVDPEAINAVIDTYGRSERNKYRAVVYYMLTKHFGKESVYG